MHFRNSSLIRISLAAVISLLLSACASSPGGPPPPDEIRSCPATNQVLVCQNRAGSRAREKVEGREPQFCTCRPKDRMTF
jgi:hypothetical protein